ncbi:MAG: hypothetical protein ACE5R6_20920 [Candidatus Heimdallarchaeota archaeon]
MVTKSLFYRRFIPETGLSVERHTENVPHDRRFHLLKDGEIIGSFTSESKAVEGLHKLLDEIGYESPPSEEKPPSPFEEDLERYFYGKEVYWGESYKYQEKGGSGR